MERRRGHLLASQPVQPVWSLTPWTFDCSAVDFDRAGWTGLDWIGSESNESGLDLVRASKRASPSWWGVE